MHIISRYQLLVSWISPPLLATISISENGSDMDVLGAARIKTAAVETRPQAKLYLCVVFFFFSI